MQKHLMKLILISSFVSSILAPAAAFAQCTKTGKCPIEMVERLREEKRLEREKAKLQAKKKAAEKEEVAEK